MSSVSFSDLRNILGKTSGPISMADAYGIDMMGNLSGQVSLNQVKGVQIQPALYQAFNPPVRSSVLGMYSVKLINANYAGPVVRIKRASDNALLDFYSDFTGNLKEITGSSYAAWIGTSTGHVMTWYDQSMGGRHASTLTGAALPPRLALDPAGSGKYVVFFPNEKLDDPDLKIRVKLLNTTPGYNSTGGTAPTFTSLDKGLLSYVRFAPGAVTSASIACQFMNYGSQTWNMGTKGFSATCRFRFTGTASSHERIFDFGNGTPSDNIILYRDGTTNNMTIAYFNGATPHYIITTATFAQNTIYNIAAVYDPAVGATGTLYFYVNGVQSQTNIPAAKATDRTLTTSNIGKSLWGADNGALNADIFSLRVYNRALTAAEVADPSEYDANYSGFSVASQSVGSFMCNFHGLENANTLHTLLGGSGDVSFRALGSSTGQPYVVTNTNVGDFMNPAGGFSLLNGVYDDTSPYDGYSNSLWNTLAFSRASGSMATLYIGMLDPAVGFLGRAFSGYMSDMVTFNAALPTSSMAGESTFSPDYKLFHKQSLARMQTGLIGRYTTESWTGTQWSDTSGAGNHATTIGGTISKASSSTSVSGLAGIEYLYGGTADNITFPAAILPATYTLFHVAKYNGATRQRIFTNWSTDWLSGFNRNEAAPNDGMSGQAYHGTWITDSTTNRHSDDWVLSTDQTSLYRSLGTVRSTGTVGTVTTVSPLNINVGLSIATSTNYDRSDWAVACVLVFDRSLSLSEYLAVEDYLAARYKVPVPIHEGLVLSLDASDYLAADSTTWRDKTTNVYNVTLTNAAAWDNTRAVATPFPFFNFNSQICSRRVSGVRTDVPTPTSTVKFTTVVVFTRVKNSTAGFRTLLRGSAFDHHVLINISTNNIGMYDNDSGAGGTFIPCDNPVDVSTLSNAFTKFNMWVFQLSSVAPYYRFYYNPSALPLQPVGEISAAASILNNGFCDIGGFDGGAGGGGAHQQWGDIASFAYYHRRLADEELVNIYNRYQVKYGMPVEKGHYQMHSPYMWFRADDLSATLAQGAGVSSWACVGPVYNRSATGLAAGTGGLPIFHKTTESRPFVRLGTGTRSTTIGNYLDCGSHTMNLSNKGGFTMICQVRFRGAAGMWERVIELGTPGVASNAIQMTRNNLGSNLYTGYYANTTQYSTAADTRTAITGGWQTIAMRVTSEELTSFYGTFKYMTAHNAGLTNRTFPATYIGRSLVADDYSNIDIRDIAFYDRALSDQQIAEVRTYMEDRVSVPKPISNVLTSTWGRVATSGLQLWLDMSLPQSFDGTGTTLFDVSGNGRNFTLSGSAYKWSSAGYMDLNRAATNAAAVGPANNSVFGIVTDHTVEFVLRNYMNGANGYNTVLLFFKGDTNHNTLNIHMPWSDNKIYYDSRDNSTGTNRMAYLTTAGALASVKHYTFRTKTVSNVTTMEVFENGVLKSGPKTITPLSNWGGASQLFWNDTTYWRGVFYYMRLYNRALSDAEVAQNYSFARDKYGIA